MKETTIKDINPPEEIEEPEIPETVTPTVFKRNKTKSTGTNTPEEIEENISSETVTVSVTYEGGFTDPYTCYSKTVDIELPVKIYEKLEKIVELSPEYENIDQYITELCKNSFPNQLDYIDHITEDYKILMYNEVEIGQIIKILQYRLDKLQKRFNNFKSNLTREEKIKFGLFYSP